MVGFVFISFLTSRLDEAIGWARKYSIFQYPFVTACCEMEYMATEDQSLLMKSADIR